MMLLQLAFKIPLRVRVDNRKRSVNDHWVRVDNRKRSVNDHCARVDKSCVCIYKRNRIRTDGHNKLRMRSHYIE